MIHFCCEESTNKIVKIFLQKNRALKFMDTHDGITVYSLNSELHPEIHGYKIGEVIPKYI